MSIPILSREMTEDDYIEFHKKFEENKKEYLGDENMHCADCGRHLVIFRRFSLEPEQEKKYICKCPCGGSSFVKRVHGDIRMDFPAGLALYDVKHVNDGPNVIKVIEK
jgi:hypothetical protein